MNNMENNNLDKVILGFLFDKPKYGYDLHKEISNQKEIGQVYRIKIGKLYALLRRLESKKLIREKIEQKGKRPPKNIFNITKKGKEAFIDWMYSPIEHGRDLRIYLLMKIFFIKKEEFFDYQIILDNQRKECQNWLDRLMGSDVKKTSFEWFVAQYRIAQVNGFLNWIDWCKKNIK